MKRADVKRGSLQPFAQLAVLGRYFRAVKKMDRKALAGGRIDVDEIMRLWEEGGQLTLRGPEPIGERKFAGTKALVAFYENRARGVDKGLSFNTSRVSAANAKDKGRLTVSGRRYVLSEKGEGMEVPFTHNFTMNGNRIQALHIHVGEPSATELAPPGALQIEDMGRLAAMAWMVA